MSMDRLVAVCVLAHPDGQGGVHPAGVDHLVDGVQDVEFGLDEPGEMPFLEQEEIALPLIPAEDPPGAGHPVLDPAVDLGHHVGLVVLRQVLQQILIVVQQQHGGHGAGVLVLVPDLDQIGDVHPVGGGQKAAAPAAGAHQVAVDPEVPPGAGHLARALALALHQPMGVEVRDQGGELGVEKVLPLAGELEEAVVGPDDVAALRAEEDHGQGSVDHGVLGGGVHIAGIALQIPAELPAAAAGGMAAVQGQTDHHGQLDPCQRTGEGRRQQGEEDQTGEIQPEAGLEQLVEFSVQGGAPLSVLEAAAAAAPPLITKDDLLYQISRGSTSTKCGHRPLTRGKILL